MKEITNCYRNYRVDIIVALAAIALVLTFDESGSLLPNFIGAALLVADFFIAKKWHGAGKLPQLEQISE